MEKDERARSAAKKREKISWRKRVVKWIKREKWGRSQGRLEAQEYAGKAGGRRAAQREPVGLAEFAAGEFFRAFSSCSRMLLSAKSTLPVSPARVCTRTLRSPSAMRLAISTA